eukprot:SAG11_NODE_11670_length_745_cov_1.479876_1_plen_33_part_10
MRQLRRDHMHTAVTVAYVHVPRWAIFFHVPTVG